MDEPKQKIKPLVRGVRDAVAEEVLLARNIPAGIVRGSVPEAADDDGSKVHYEVSIF